MVFKIKELRNRTGYEMTQKELSKKSGVSLNVISYLESGRQADAKFSHVVKLANAMNVSPLDLIYEDTNI